MADVAVLDDVVFTPHLGLAGGVLVILISGGDNAERARTLLRREGYSAA